MKVLIENRQVWKIASAWWLGARKGKAYHADSQPSHQSEAFLCLGLVWMECWADA